MTHMSVTEGEKKVQNSIIQEKRRRKKIIPK